MSNDKSKKTDSEVCHTRRALIKAGWAVPIILSIGLPVGNVFANASTGGQTATTTSGRPSLF